MKRPNVGRWTWEQTLSEAVLLRNLEMQGYSASRWIKDAGFKFPPRRDNYDKVILVVRGSITYRIPQTNEDFALHPGDRLELPAGFAYDSLVGSQGVLCLEGQSPVDDVNQD
ncbi:MAG: cupin [Chloroflexi bacterium]|nr:cupin [Chloroflexota bacterium]